MRVRDENIGINCNFGVKFLLAIQGSMNDFYEATERTWNSLSFCLTSAISLSTFRCQLKTLLFSRSYPDRFHCTWQTVFVLCRKFRFFRLTLLGVLAVMTLGHLNQFFDGW